MKGEFVTVLRRPDLAVGATEASPYRFEERGETFENPDCPVKFDYDVAGRTARVTVYPSGSPVKYLKLRFCGDLSFADRVYGDQWERSGGNNAALEWRSLYAQRVLPWFCYVMGEGRTACYGVKTGADCFAYWQVDTRGLTLFLNLTCGNAGTALSAPITACELTELVGDEGEDPFKTACRFSRMLCEKPALPREPVFGVNNWYWAYGRISKESVLHETDCLLELTEGVRHRPYMIIDDGWQLNRSYGAWSYIGGPWTANDRFGDMAETAAAIREKGAKAGIWFRPLLTLGDVPEEAKLAAGSNGQLLDPSHPWTAERVEADAARIRSWGYELIKHDFSTGDITGNPCLTSVRHGASMVTPDRRFYDRTRTTATIMKDFYKAVQRGAGDADVIGCNVVSHLAAGIHSIMRVGDDTSGRSFEWTVRNGVNSMMRLPLNRSFYLVDPDCAAFTERVDHSLNLDYLEMCALTGVTALASVTPGCLTAEETERIRRIFRLSDEGKSFYGIRNYEKTSLPERFVSEDGADERVFDWMSAYDGSRSVLNWMN